MFTGKIREKSIGKIRPRRLLAVLLALVVALILGAAAPEGWANDAIPFDEAEVFFEFNSTDLDLGFDIFMDAEPWTSVRVIGPDGRIFKVLTDGGLQEQGNTEIMTESAEPGFCEDIDEYLCDDEFIQTKIDEFQAHFPEGWYQFRGTTIDGEIMRGGAYLSHELPAPPEIISPEEEDELSNPFIIKWAPGEDGPAVREYEVVAEMVINGRTFKNTAILPGWAKRLTVSPQFIGLAARALAKDELEEFKVEIVARAANLNKTITELAVFELEAD